MKKLSIDDLQKYIQKDDTSGCWIWLKTSPSKNGYCSAGRHNLAHIWVYQNIVGSTNGLHLHHECKNKRCVNPEHLKLVLTLTHPDHSSFLNRMKTHCPHGHEYSPENTILDKKGHRKCRTCRNNRNRTRDSEISALRYKYNLL